MKSLRSVTLILTLILTLPLAALAMSHGDGEKKMDHDKMEMDHGKMEMDHDGMKMSGDMIMLGDDTEDGVRAMAHLKDVSAAMAKMGMEATHHIMLKFVDVASGQPVDSGMAAVKIEGPDGKESAPIKLMGMEGHFGADIQLPVNGEYEFKIGTKLADGKKRQFEFKFQMQ